MDEDTANEDSTGGWVEKEVERIILTSYLLADTFRKVRLKAFK